MEFISGFWLNIRQDTKRQCHMLHLIAWWYFRLFKLSFHKLLIYFALWRQHPAWRPAEKNLEEESGFSQGVMKTLSCSETHNGGSVDFTEQDTADTLAQEHAARREMRDRLQAAKSFQFSWSVSVVECAVTITCENGWYLCFVFECFNPDSFILLNTYEYLNYLIVFILQTYRKENVS